MSNYQLYEPDMVRLKSILGSARNALHDAECELFSEAFLLQDYKGIGIEEITRQIKTIRNVTKQQVDNIRILEQTTQEVINVTKAAEQRASFIQEGILLGKAAMFGGGSISGLLNVASYYMEYLGYKADIAEIGMNCAESSKANHDISKVGENIKVGGAVGISGFLKEAFGLEWKNADIVGKCGTIGNAVSYAGILLDTSSHFVQNVEARESEGKIVADTATDIVFGLGEMAVSAGCAKVGMAIGTAICPGLGTVGGVIVGAAVGWLGSAAYKYLTEKPIINNKSIKERVSEGTEDLIDTNVEILKSGAKKIGQAVAGWFRPYQVSFG
ncbi:MAG: hypothetical protein RR746_05675 [Lachnospiraceae bacterium]